MCVCIYVYVYMIHIHICWGDIYGYIPLRSSQTGLTCQFDTNVSQLLRRVFPWSYDPLPSLGELSSSSLNRKCVLLSLKLSVDQSNRPYDLKKHLFCHAPGSSVLGSLRSSAYRDVCVQASTSRLPEPTPLPVYRSVPPTHHHLTGAWLITPMLIK